jgi:pantetheine-phosphate adenylyltransferase
VSVSAVCPGSFDPVTHGHLDIIRRAARRFDELVVAVVGNPGKTSLFTLDERVAMVEQETAGIDGVRIAAFEGLLVDFCRAEGIGVVCRGLRGVADFEFEQQMAQMNLSIGDVETVFLATSPSLSHLSSSLIKEVARLGGRIDDAVPPRVATALVERIARG